MHIHTVRTWVPSAPGPGYTLVPGQDALEKYDEEVKTVAAAEAEEQEKDKKQEKEQGPPAPHLLRGASYERPFLTMFIDFVVQATPLDLKTHPKSGAFCAPPGC